MFIVYEKIIYEVTDGTRWVVKEFEDPKEIGNYVDNRLKALKNLGYKCGVRSKDGIVECHNEKTRVFRVISVAEQKRFVSTMEYEKRRKECDEADKRLAELVGDIFPQNPFGDLSAIFGKDGNV